MASASKTRVVIADDHRIFLDGLVGIFEKEDAFDVVGTAVDFRESKSRIQEHTPDLLLTDLNMPGINGVQMIRELRTLYPNLTIVVLTMYHDKHMVKELSETGIAGYLLKHTDSDGIISSLKRILAGEIYVDENLQEVNNNRDFGHSDQSGEFKDDFESGHHLGQREKELMLLVAQGLSNQEVADTMFVSIDTVYSHRKHIKRKLGLTNNAQFVSYANRLASKNQAPNTQP